MTLLGMRTRLLAAAAVLLALAGPVSAQAPPAYLTEWGSLGTGDGQMNFPTGVAVDGAGNVVYVADRLNHRVQKFDSAGVFLTKWGTSGAGLDEFASPSDVAVDSAGNVYVVSFNSRVQKFDANGIFSGVIWGSASTIRFPEGLAVDGAGNVYVAVTGYEEINKYDSTGNLILQWGALGSGAGEFNDPYGVAADSSAAVRARRGGVRKATPYQLSISRIPEESDLGAPATLPRSPRSSLLSCG